MRFYFDGDIPNISSNKLNIVPKIVNEIATNKNRRSLW